MKMEVEPWQPDYFFFGQVDKLTKPNKKTKGKKEVQLHDIQYNLIKVYTNLALADQQFN